MSLDPDHCVELAEMLQFIGGWLGADAEVLTASLHRFVGADGYGIADLRDDLARFAFLLGDDGGELFGARGA